MIVETVHSMSMFGTNLICPKAGYETQGLRSSFGHADLYNKIMNRKKPILRVLYMPMSCIAFIGYLNYIKDVQAFFWLNPL